MTNTAHGNKNHLNVKGQSIAGGKLDKARDDNERNIFTGQVITVEWKCQQNATCLHDRYLKVQRYIAIYTKIHWPILSHLVQKFVES